MIQVVSVLGQQIREIWKRFGINQKVSIIMALVVCIAAIGSLVYWSTRPDYRILYSGLDLKDAAAMREKIDDAKIPLQIRDSGHSIYVPASEVYRARLLLAAEGLPKESKTGFELFEQPKFGLTDFAQQINYQRALQGELERTLTTMSNIESARVTLVLPKERLFATEKEKSARASIMLTLAGGATLSSAQVRSVTHLVASAVPGLEPSAITVVDQEGKLLSAAAGPAEDQAVQAGDQLTIQRSLEGQLSKNVQDMLDTFLGKNRSVVKVSSEMDFSRIEKRNEKYDKEGRVVKTEKIISETSTKPGASAGGTAGTQVNVPVSNPSNVQADQGQSKSKKENIQTEYAVPSGVEMILQTGARIQRLSVSVCVAKGANSRTEQQMTEIGALVKAAVGFVNDPVRGRVDSVEVKEMEFQVPEEQAPLAWWLRLPVRMESLMRGLLLSILLIVVFLVGRRVMTATMVQSAEIGVPVRSVGQGRGETPISESKEVNIDLLETLQAVKEDPKKAVAWITRTIER